MNHIQALVILGVGIGTGIGLVVIFDKERVIRSGKRIAKLLQSAKGVMSEHRELSRQLRKAEGAVSELKESITQHLAERDLLELIYVSNDVGLESTKRVNADEAIVYGRGREWVYLYTFATQEALADERRQRNYPMKLGMSTQDNVVTRVNQQVSGTSTALSERAILRLVFRVNQSAKMEKWMHQQLDHMGRKVEESIGVEWYNTNPTEVEQLFKSFVLKYSRSQRHIVE